MSEVDARASIKLKSFRGSAGWARVLNAGTVELELFDHSEKARDCFGNDVAWLYRIAENDKPALIQSLQEHIGVSITDDRSLLAGLDRSFSDVWTIRDWLKEKNIPYREEFDDWA